MNNRVCQGHVARKRFGQNFLTNPLIIDSIIAAIHPQKGEAMVEIGPGLGALTLPATACLDSMMVIELDRDLAKYLASHPQIGKKIILYQQDAMTVDFATLAMQAGQSLRIFGNLPYNISTPLMFHLFNYCHVIRNMYFMLQKEVVDRLVARPDTKAYGRLTVMAQYYCHIISVLDVPPMAFTPVPKVDSAVVCLIPHAQIPNPVENVSLLNTIVTQAFSQRRKTIRNSLSHFFSPQQLIELDVDPSLRAENIAVSQYCTLANWLTAQSALSE